MAVDNAGVGAAAAYYGPALYEFLERACFGGGNGVGRVFITARPDKTGSAFPAQNVCLKSVVSLYSQTLQPRLEACAGCGLKGASIPESLTPSSMYCKISATISLADEAYGST